MLLRCALPRFGEYGFPALPAGVATPTGRNPHDRVGPFTPARMKGWCGTHVGRARRHRRGFRAPARADQRSAFQAVPALLPDGRYAVPRRYAPLCRAPPGELPRGRRSLARVP